MFLHGQGQLQFSDSEGRQGIYTSCSYSSKHICTTDCMLKHYHQQKVEKYNNPLIDPAHAQLCELNDVRKSTTLFSVKHAQEPGDEATTVRQSLISTILIHCKK